MKQLLYSILIAFLCFSCGGSNTPENQSGDSGKKENSEDPAVTKETPKIPADTVKHNGVVYPLTAPQIAKLSKLLPKKTVNQIKAYMDALASVKTDNDFARVYHNGKPLFETIENDLYTKFPDDAYNAMEAMRFINKTFALRASCEAECSEFVMEYSFTDLQKLAAYTKGKADDAFVKLKMMAEGENARHDPSWLNFFERTWDYGGGSLLGDGNNALFLEESFQAIQQSDLFKKDLIQLRERVIEDMKHRIYMFPKAAVMAELDKILKGKYLAYDEAQEILDLRQKIDRDKEDPALQFNCSDPEQNCDWGG